MRHLQIETTIGVFLMPERSLFKFSRPKDQNVSLQTLLRIFGTRRLSNDDRRVPIDLLGYQTSGDKEGYKLEAS